MKTAGIIGGLDFLGCDITLKFLSENYLVKVLNSSLSNQNSSIINTGLKASDCLQIHSVDFKNTLEFSNHIKDCDFLIHCGIPFKLNLKTIKEPVFVPIVKDTYYLLKALYKTPRIEKVIFLSAAADLYETYNGAFSDSGQLNKTNSTIKKSGLNKALYHSNKIINKALRDFAQNRFQIYFVSPVTVVKNSMTNNRESVMAGLKYLFHNKINHDKIFKKLIERNLVETMLNVNEIPDKIFESVSRTATVKEHSVFL